MNKSVFPVGLFGTVALLIALTAFALGQLHAGAGVPFAALAATIWTAYVSARQRRRID